jgi:hypothetical protein
MQPGNQHLHHLVHGVAPIAAAVVEMERLAIALHIGSHFTTAAMAENGEI